MAAKANPIQIQKFLAGVDYPAKKRELVEHAKEHGADEIVLATLERLPDREYDRPTAIAHEVGKLKKS